jgi:dienelactone hydrolase
VTSTVFLALLVLSSGLPDESATRPFPRGEIVSRIECGADPAHSYALYLPSGYSRDRTWPVLYLYDPRRRGLLAAERFRDAAERYGWILASSNDTMSDDPTAENDDAVRAMWADVNGRFSVDPRRVYAAGFSGGARLAVLLAQAMRERVAGVIACGGGFPNSAPPGKETRFAFFGAVGDVDFNYGEMRRLDRTLARLGVMHRLAVFEGPHSWCPAPVCREGIEWLELQAMRSGARPKDPALVERLFAERLERAAALEAAGKLSDAFVRYAEAAEDFHALVETNAADAARARLGKEPAVQRAVEDEVRSEETEARLGARLSFDLNAALVSDPTPPAKAIANRLGLPKLRKDASADRPEIERRSAARLIEQLYVQAAFYLPRELVSKREFRRAEISIGIAEELKPDRAAGAWYNLACFRATAGDRRGALESLRAAVAKGFRDTALVETDPDLASLRGEKDYRAILEELKRPTS